MTAAEYKPCKKLIKRALLEHSQPLRHSMQIAFLALNAWIGVQFYSFVRYYETGGLFVRRMRRVLAMRRGMSG